MLPFQFSDETELQGTVHKDFSDWNHSFTALVPLGNFEGGDLLIRQLGLRIEGLFGCAQFIRGKDLFHPINKGRQTVRCREREQEREKAAPESESTLTDKNSDAPCVIRDSMMLSIYRGVHKKWL